MTNLEQQFEHAGLVLKELTEPMSSNPDTFGMDVQRKIRGNARSEYFRIYRGHKDNLVQVLNVDKKLKQLVLLVKEPPRTFVSKDRLAHFQIKHLEDRFKRQGSQGEWKSWKDVFYYDMKRQKMQASNLKDDGTYDVAGKTPSSTRYYLCGVDERQLFIAQLPRHITTVAQAHQELKGGNVTTAEGKAGGRTLRQGEFFLLNLTNEEDNDLRLALKKKQLLIEKNVNIGTATGTRTGGKPHIAEEAVKIPIRHAVNRVNNVYVRGRISHPDHKTIKLGAWRKVLKNNEAEMEGAQRGANGVYWID